METGNLECGFGGIVKLNALCKVQRNDMTWPGDWWRECTSKGVRQKRENLHWTKYFEWSAEAD